MPLIQRTATEGIAAGMGTLGYQTHPRNGMLRSFVDVETAQATIATEAPRRLRLDELLRELGAHDGAPPPAASRADALTVGMLVDKAEEGGFGFLVGVLSLIAIPFVGLSTPFGLVTALLDAQLMIGLHHPWLPARARRRKLLMAMLDRVLGILARRTRW